MIWAWKASATEYTLIIFHYFISLGRSDEGNCYLMRLPFEMFHVFAGGLDNMGCVAFWGHPVFWGLDGESIIRVFDSSLTLCEVGPAEG